VPVDLNGDDRGERDMLGEFQGLSGFVKDWIKCTVERVDENTLAYNAAIPVYVTDKSNGKSEIKYYDISIEAEWHREWGKPGFVIGTYKPAADDSVFGLEEAGINNYDKNSIDPSGFELYVRCTIPCKDIENNSDSMIFTFVKE